MHYSHSLHAFAVGPSLRFKYLHTLTIPFPLANQVPNLSHKRNLNLHNPHNLMALTHTQFNLQGPSNGQDVNIQSRRAVSEVLAHARVTVRHALP